MKDRLADKAAAALVEKLEALGLVIRPKVPTEEMFNIGEDSINHSRSAQSVWIAMSAAAPEPDTKALAQAVLDVVLEGET